MVAMLAMTGLIFIFLEFFMPGAIMAVGGTLMLIASLAIFYSQATVLQFFIYLLCLIAALVVTLYLAMRRIKKSKVPHTETQGGFQACQYPIEMVGRSANVISDLKPCGYIEIDGRSFAALSKLGYIDKGEIVRIIGGQGTHLIVDQEKIHHDSASH